LKSKKLHIVSFDVPFPPNYGGVIDVYYKCKSLHALGFEINLHCYQYGREPAEKLLSYCKTVNYYKRNKIINPALLYGASALPYIVSTRADKRLLENLLKDDAPILFEGLHSTYLLNEPSIDNNRCYVRTHNIEHEYYKKLADVERNPFKRLFFNKESQRLAQYEQVLKKAKMVFSISQPDKIHFEKVNPNTALVSAFHESATIESLEGVGNYALYHGNLAVGENNHAACYLAENVFPKVDFPCMIAGNNPSNKLISLCKKNNIQLVDNKSNKEIIDLIKNAQINVLVTFQKTGIKLKLLNALFKGRHCIVNEAMVDATGLETLCHISNIAEDLAKSIEQLKNTPFTQSEIEKRQHILGTTFDNLHNATLIDGYIFG